ncbi:MAG: phosphonate ABC transporter ATP-binding protein [Rhodospirillales bacterium]|nr:phosphonate ABC transporter ATP-binding protein [Rhodospirillales bacterium]
MPLVSLKNVTKIYANGVTALQSLTRDFEAGSFTVVIGPSGAGKSTLLRTINGLETPSAGEVHVDGQPVTHRDLRSIRAKIGMVFQEFNLVDRLNVMTNVLAGRLAHRHWSWSLGYLFSKSDYEMAHQALDRVGLVDKAWSRADQLSGGQRQRVGIARAICQQPRLILADEPVASLDPGSAVEVMDLLAGICREDGIAVVANLHQLDLTKRYADRVIALRAGRVIYDGKVINMDDATFKEIYESNKDTHGKRHEHTDLVLAHA